MNRKIIIVCGPTATGKTELALHLAEQFNGELLSADSRQVYKGMDVGTGKDIPSQFSIFNSQFSINTRIASYYSDGTTRIWGYDIVAPNQQFSVAEYIQYGQAVLMDIWERGKLPIVVGGTGMYIQGLIHPPQSVGIKPDHKLRNELEKLTVDVLQAKLKLVDVDKFNLMNQSDRHNPRRLIRAIEVASNQDSGAGSLKKTKLLTHNTLWIGVRRDRDVLTERIRQRVDKRLVKEMIEEVRSLNLDSLADNLPAKTALGYRQVQEYLNGNLSLEQTKEQWILSELQYSKRQLTWFSKNKEIEWFEAGKKDLQTRVVAHLRKVL